MNFYRPLLKGIFIIPLLLCACSKQPTGNPTTQVSPTGFTIGGSRDDIAKELKKAQAKTIEETKNLVLADFKYGGEHVMRVRLDFTNDHVSQVTYAQQ